MREMTTQEVGASLGVSARFVRDLVESGRLDGEQLPGGTWMISPPSVERYRAVRRDRGRAWSPHTSWAALGELSGHPLGGLSPRTAARLRARLAVIDMDEFARKVNARLETTRWSAVYPEKIRKQLILTSSSAAEMARTDLAPTIGVVEGYTPIAQDRFIESNLMIPDQHGSIVLFGSLPGFPRARYAPDAVIAADLARSIHSREREAGLGALDELRSAWLGRNTR